VAKLQSALEASATRGRTSSSSGATWLPPGRAIPLRQQTKQLQAVAKVVAQELRDHSAHGDAHSNGNSTASGAGAGGSSSQGGSSSSTNTRQAVVGMEWEEENGWSVAQTKRGQKQAPQQQQQGGGGGSRNASQGGGQVATAGPGAAAASAAAVKVAMPGGQLAPRTLSSQEEQGPRPAPEPERKGETWVTGMDQ
jgi:hypothetical protein